MWACDPIGSSLFIVGATLTLLALDWAGGSYGWHSSHVVAPLTVGLVSLLAFGIYGEFVAEHQAFSIHLLTKNLRMERSR